MYKTDKKEINHVLLKKYKSYLDWIELVYFNNIDNINDYMKLNVIKKNDLLKELNEDNVVDEDENIITKLNKRAIELEKTKTSELAKVLKWKYFYMDS